MTKLIDTLCGALIVAGFVAIVLGALWGMAGPTP